MGEKVGSFVKDEKGRIIPNLEDEAMKGRKVLENKKTAGTRKDQVPAREVKKDAKG